jgi:hypothetical protein
MLEIDRRQVVASVTAAVACAAAEVRGTAAISVGSRLSACRSGLLLANSDRIREIGPGWIPIVAATLEKMTAIDPRLEIRQIKQKCGELRIYYRSHRYEELELAVNEAEVLCGKTCEECGRPGSLFNRDGWVRTLCEEHRTFLRP